MTTLTEREQALIGNRANKTPGSTSWSWQTIEALQYMWENLRNLPQLIRPIVA